MSKVIIMAIPTSPVVLAQFGFTYEDTPEDIKVDCMLCQQECWLSPKKQEMWNKHPEALILCGVCVALHAPLANARQVDISGDGNGPLKRLPKDQ